MANCFPVRYQIALMLFFHASIVYMIRVNLSVNIIAMQGKNVNKTENRSCTEGSCRVIEIDPDKYYGHYEWTQHQEAALLGGYFYGYVTTSLFGGIVCERFGPRIVVAISTAICGLLSFLTPVAVGLHYAAMFLCRFFSGMAAGISFPGNQGLIAKWAPPDERSIFVSTIVGSGIGTFLTWIMCSQLSEHVGWDWAFYVCGFCCFIMVIFWIAIVYDEPSQHKYIKDEEREYIENSLKGLIMRKRQLPPFKELIKSVPFFATVILHIGHMWNLYFYMTSAPIFFKEVLDYPLSRAGFLAGLPYLLRAFAVFVFAAVGDKIRQYQLLTVTFTRHFFCLFSHIIPGLTFMLLAVFNESVLAVSILICVCITSNAAAVLTNLINIQDLAPNFAASLYGIMNFFSNMAGFLAPIMVAEITRDNETADEWRTIFIICSGFYLIPALVFLLFGTGELQPWNTPKSNEPDE